MSKAIGRLTAVLLVSFAALALTVGGRISIHTLVVTAILASWFVLAQIIGGGMGGGGGNGGVTPPPPFDVSPNSGPNAGGTAVTITGTSGDYTGPATVTFGGIPATNVVVVDGHTITCTTPAGATGAVTVIVTAGGPAQRLTNGFSYLPPPQPIYGGPGQPGATTATLAGNTVVLNDSANSILPQLQTSAEQVGQSWSFTGLNNQCVYLLLFGGSHTFIDANTGFPFAFNAAIAVGVSGTMYLYQSTNPLFGSSQPRVAS